MIPVDTKVCAHFGICGGCSRQNTSYDDQLKMKEDHVRQGLAEFDVENFHSIRPSPDIFFYRNKMEFSFGDQRDLDILQAISTGTRRAFPSRADNPKAAGAVHVGLHPKGRFALVTPTPDCLLLSEDSQRVLPVVAAWATELGVRSFLRNDGSGDLRHLVIREGKNTHERMVNLVAKSTTPKVEELAHRLRSSGIPITTFLWSRHDGLSDVAHGSQAQIFWGEGSIQEKIGSISVRIKPSSFMQTNTHAAEGMLRLLKGWFAEHRATTIIDLYCGSGVIGLNLAEPDDELIGIEINREAVDEAAATAAANGRASAHFLSGRVEDLIDTEKLQASKEHAVVVVDPPRAGLHPQVVEALLQWAAPALFYVSCNPGSLARDLRRLVSRYRILDGVPMDFFPHTDHIETAVRLQRR